MEAASGRRTASGVLALLAIGVLIGVGNNVLAGKTRTLEWVKDYPAKGPPACPQTLPGDGVTASDVTPAAEPPVTAAVPASDGATSAAPVEIASASGSSGGAIGGSAPLAASAPAAATNASSPASAPVPPPAASASSPPAATGGAAVPPVPPGKPYVEITTEQSKTLFDQHALFVDARRTDIYAEGHVPGALSIPVWESGVDEKVQSAVFEVKGDMAAPIVAYCGGGDCEDSHTLAQKLFEGGHTAVYVYHDGFPGWSDKGHPVTRGAGR